MVERLFVMNKGRDVTRYIDITLCIIVPSSSQANLCKFMQGSRKKTKKMISISCDR